MWREFGFKAKHENGREQQQFVSLPSNLKFHPKNCIREIEKKINGIPWGYSTKGSSNDYQKENEDTQWSEKGSVI